MKKLFLLIFLFVSLKLIVAQETVYTPLSDLNEFSEEIKVLRDFHIYKNKLDELIESKKFKIAYTYSKKMKISSFFNVQISQSLMELYLVLNKKKEIKETIKNYIEKTCWKEHVIYSTLFPSRFEKYESYKYAKNYFKNNYSKIFDKNIKKNSELLNKIFWLNAINQRDQDYRKYITYKYHDGDECSDGTLNYFDSLNLFSIKAYIKEYGYPKFNLGARYINLALIHYNKQEILNLSEFNYFSKLIWKSVIIGVTSLSDYCYMIDRYLVTNQKKDPLFGFYNSTNTNCVNFYLNTKKIGLTQ